MITVIIDKTAFTCAINEADKIGRNDEIINGLHAPLDGALTGWVEEAWEAVRGSLDRAYQFGEEAAKSALQSAEQTIDKILLDAKKRAGDVSDALNAKIARYVTILIDEMLKHVRRSISVGESHMNLVELKVSQKMIIGGSIKASLKEAIALTSSSEFNIEASYRVE